LCSFFPSDFFFRAGETPPPAKVDYEKIARETIARIGYRSPDLGFSSDSCKVLLNYGQQSPDIAQGVNEGEGLDLEQGAGDQGLMFGYACDETPVLMPFAIYYSHRLMQRQSELRRNGSLPWLRPDAKAQITAVYDSKTGKVKRIDTVVLSTQHDEGISYDELREAVIEQIIKPVLPSEMLTEETKYLVNPTGKFIIGHHILAVDKSWRVLKDLNPCFHQIRVGSTGNNLNQLLIRNERSHDTDIHSPHSSILNILRQVVVNNQIRRGNVDIVRSLTDDILIDLFPTPPLINGLRPAAIGNVKPFAFDSFIFQMSDNP